MYKVVIVDDEPLICEGLQKSIGWDELGCEVLSIFTNSMLAYDYVLNNKVDILLLDINMPELDGLNFAKSIHENGCNTKVLIISAYKDFKHVQKALQIGVFDYIAKPIRNNDLIDVVNRVIKSIEGEERENEVRVKHRQEMAMLHEYFEKSKQLVKTNLINNLLSGQDSEHNFKDLIQIMPKNTISYSVMMIKHMSKIEDEGINKRYLLEYIKNYDRQSEIELKATVYENNIVVLIFFKTNVNEYSAKIIAKNLGKNILEYINEWKDVSLCIGVSTLYKDVGNLRTSYLAALSVAENQFFTSKSDIGFTSVDKEIRKYKVSIIHQIDNFYSTLYQLDSTRIADIQNAISEFFEELKYYCKSIDEAKSIIMEVCITMVRLYVSNDKYNDKEISISDIINDVNSINSLKQAEKYVLSLLSKANSEQKNEYSIIVNESIKYIHTKYNSSLSLSEVSEHLNVNSSYLSRVIKKETDKNFSEILTDARICAAKKFLLDPKLRLNEIATLIGYKDYAYFYQVFKRVTGDTPMNYRKQMTN